MLQEWSVCFKCQLSSFQQLLASLLSQLCIFANKLTHIVDIFYKGLKPDSWFVEIKFKDESIRQLLTVNSTEPACNAHFCFEDSQSSLIFTMSSCALIKHSWCYHGFHISTFPCLMNPAPTLDPGRAPCCGAIHVWLRGLPNGCRPCSLFSIASIHNLSTCGCILITLLSVLHFLHLERHIPGRRGFAASLSDLRGLSAG